MGWPSTCLCSAWTDWGLEPLQRWKKTDPGSPPSLHSGLTAVETGGPVRSERASTDLSSSFPREASFPVIVAAELGSWSGTLTYPKSCKWSLCKKTPSMKICVVLCVLVLSLNTQLTYLSLYCTCAQTHTHTHVFFCQVTKDKLTKKKHENSQNFYSIESTLWVLPWKTEMSRISAASFHPSHSRLCVLGFVFILFFFIPATSSVELSGLSLLPLSSGPSVCPVHTSLLLSDDSSSSRLSSCKCAHAPLFFGPTATVCTRYRR